MSAKNTVPAFVIAFLLAVSLAGAQEMEHYTIESRIQPDLSVSHQVSLKWLSPVNSFEFNFGSLPVDLVADPNTVSCQSSGDKISCVSAQPFDTVTLNFLTRNNIQISNGSYTFSLAVPIDSSLKRFFHSVYIPEGSSLISDSPEDSYSPRYGQTLSDGKHIIIYWEKLNVSANDDQYFSVSYRLAGGSSVYDVMIMLIIAVVIVIFLAFYYFRHGREASIHVVMPLLREDEKRVIEILEQKGGKVNQRVIVRETDFSKAKVSRLIAGLKERKIVGVEHLGRTNMITLKIKK